LGTLGTGHWALGTGHWALGTGHWALGTLGQLKVRLAGWQAGTRRVLGQGLVSF